MAMSRSGRHLLRFALIVGPLVIRSAARELGCSIMMIPAVRAVRRQLCGMIVLHILPVVLMIPLIYVSGLIHVHLVSVCSVVIIPAAMMIDRYAIRYSVIVVVIHGGA